MPSGLPATDQEKEIVYAAIAKGLNNNDACRKAHLTYQWFNDNYRSDAIFRGRVDQAREEAKEAAIDSFRAGFGKDWKAGYTWLKSRHRNEWGEHIGIKHSGSVSGGIADSLTPEEKRQIADIAIAAAKRKIQG
jgi:hypothetical protein